MGKRDKSGQMWQFNQKKNVKKFNKLKNGLNRAIFGKRDKSDQSWTGKRDSKKVLLKLLFTRAKNLKAKKVQDSYRAPNISLKWWHQTYPE